VILVIDNFDSFTYNLVAYFKELGEEVDVVTNEILFDQIDLTKYKGVVLSPGPSLPKDSNNLLTLVRELQGSIPMLGICLGHQALAQVNGAVLKRMNRPQHGKVCEINCTGDVLFEKIPQHIDVVRYHSWYVEKLPDNFRVVAETRDGQLMAFENEALKICGIQFHPESILTDFGLDILRNWLTNQAGIS
jgi:anthranilate synthase/aminodeoxychorismate synthase-like glutamine amidotransferase